MANKKSFLLIVIAVFMLTILACNATLPQTEPTSAPIQPVTSTLEQPQPQQGQDNLPQTEDDVPRVTAEDAKAALDSGEAVIVDERSAEAFAETHIAGALSIPLSDIELNPSRVALDKDQWIITYCT